MRTAHSGYLRPPLVCVFLLTGFDPALAQQTGTPTAFEPIEFRSPGTNVWQRPAGARFALLWGCGGGGGGGRGDFEWGPSTVAAPEGGTGGGATIPTMKFAGRFVHNHCRSRRRLQPRRSGDELRRARSAGDDLHFCGGRGGPLQSG